MEKSEEKSPPVPKTKFSSLAIAGLRLALILMAQSFALWLISKWYPDVACSSIAASSCQPKPITEKLLLQAFVPMIFISLAIIQAKQIITLAGNLTTSKRWLVVLSCSGALLFMVWQFLSAMGALLGRWFG